VQFYSVDFDTLAEVEKNKENIQLTARKLRYDWLNKLAIKKNACIALGHHQDDQVETFLIQLNRGGGLRGLCAMTVKNNNYLRPLLSKTKNWIITYAKANDLTWREDSSNHQNKYQRNLFRNVLLANNKGIGIQALELINNFKSLQKTVNTIAQKVTANWLASHVLLSWSKTANFNTKRSAVFIKHKQKPK
jgi:Predicted ATPase of the PP-loop superfamily implicated in cell cycle control